MRMFSPLASEWTRRTLPSATLGDVFEDLDRMVETFVRPSFSTGVNYQPSCNIDEAADHYMVSLDMPGVKPEDIKIEVKGGQLTVSGERQREFKNHEQGSTLRHERFYGKFERSFLLPESIDTEKIEAQCDHGVLRIALPKAESAKGRTIQIQTGQSGLFSRLLGSKKEASKELKDVRVS